MPEMHVIVRWPDDSVMACYSPSLVIRDYLEVGQSYNVEDFVVRARAALAIGSERVREKYGFACSRATRMLDRIEAKARAFAPTATGNVRVESYRE